jgi:hypothetical protein
LSNREDVVASKGTALACCRRADDSAPDDLYPDADARRLQDAFRSLGVSSTMVSWDDPSIDWELFGHVVISSTWDSVDRPVEYLAWARHVADLTVLVNSVEFIEWNLDKTHQRELDTAGVPTIPTNWIAPGDEWTPPATTEFVVKPSISAGGRSTARYAAGDRAAVDHVRALHSQGQTVMVQPYLDAIDTEDEVNVVLFDGIYSHAVKKRPALKVGRTPVERPWERMAWEGVAIPTAAEMGVADATIAAVRQRFGRLSAGSRAVISLRLLSTTAASSPRARRIDRRSCGGNRAPRVFFPPGPASRSGTMRSTGMPSVFTQDPGCPDSRLGRNPASLMARSIRGSS